MKTRDDYIKEMTSGNVLQDRELTFKEYVSEITQFQNNVCRMIAGNEYHDGMRFDEAMFIFESTARKKGLRNDPAIHNGVLTMKKLCKEMAITMSGAKGENIVAKTLEYLNRPNTKVYHNVYLTDGVDETELDGIVLTDEGIIILEVKKVKSDLTLTEEGRMVFASDECYDKVPLADKMALKRRLLKSVLSKILDEKGLNIPIFVDSLIVFSSPKGQYIKIDDRYRKEKYCFRTGLNHKIETYIGCAYYRDVQLEHLDKIFCEMESNVKRFETELNYEEVRRSLAEAMVVLKDESESIAVENNPVDTIEYKAKVITSKVNNTQFKQKPKNKIFDFNYIAAGTAACVVGMAMIFGVGRKRV